MFEKAISNLNFDARIRAESSVSALKYIDMMIEDFKVRDSKSKADILLDVFGLLQGLFVGIDSLYQLSIAITKYKYHININQNEKLRELKYIRNDVVGHPTNRSYEDGSYGFSFILNEAITKDNLSYMSYIIKDKEIRKKKIDVEFKEVISAYEEAKIQVLDDIASYLERKPSKIDIPGYIVNMFERGMKKEFNEKDITELKVLVMKDQNIKSNSPNRLIWHIKLLNKTYAWKDDKYQELIDYLRLKEMLNIYKIYLDLTDKKIRLPYLEKPELLTRFEKELKRINKYDELMTYFKDKNHPLFNEHLEMLINLVEDDELDRLLIWFSKISDSDQSYLIGKTLKDN
ncbi:hypothetical protein [Acholeplasma hippikon]|uniref:Uncharacterized protein n=1 Tax=Acholeplasma hippikon TaxID=264636 RepID=A0A449BJI6_9MOLU|nr:hypothetical protein [Acholeplasma hippikon]VEU82553.1 Uncharacterised protein [Acholeplasma hippikon]